MTTTARIDATDVATLADALQSQDRIRLCGRGTNLGRLAPVGNDVTTVSTAGMRRILRLEADDLTCSVEPGVLRAELDAALAEHRLWLPCGGPSTGTIGGTFAGDWHGPDAPGQPEPRALLLGLEGILTDGTVFKSGARVVKSVAGFDLQKLFVGSHGRLFAATALHLKLRPMPRATLSFHNEDMTLAAAIDLTIRLRRTQTPPTRLDLVGHGDTFCVQGVLGGESAQVEAFARQFDLQPGTVVETDPERDPGSETIQGQVPVGRLAELIAGLPEGAPFVHRGTRFVVSLPEAAGVELLTRLPKLDGNGVVIAADGDRRGARSTVDPIVARLEADLEAALDPRGVLR